MASVLKIDTIKSLQGNTAMTITESGVPLLNVPMFSARLLTETNINNGAVGTVLLDEIFDSNNWYNPSTGVFSPTTPGYYQLNGTIEYRASSSLTRILVRFQDEDDVYLYGTDVLAGSSTVGRVSVSALHYFNGTTNTIRLTYFCQGVSPVIDNDQTVFSGFLVRGA
jgi:hypothetical protein